jgi:hypothetical protein
MLGIRTTFLLLIIGILPFTAPAQMPAYANSPVRLRLVTRENDSVKINEYGIVIREGAFAFVNVINEGKERYYISLLDIQPDNRINVLFPAPLKGIRSEDLFIPPGVERTFNTYRIQILPPYGIDKLLLIVSKTPDLGRSLIDAGKKVTRGQDPINDKISTKSDFLQEVKWILQGEPSEIFKDCFFSVMDMVIIPREVEKEKKSIKQSSQATTGLNSFLPTKASWKYKTLAEERCIDKIKDLDNLYRVYPLLSFMQPLQAGATRGAVLAHSVNTAVFVIKGFASASKGIKEVLINNEKGKITSTSAVQSSWEMEVELQEGENKFLVNVITKEGKENCEELILNYKASNSESSEKPRNYSLFIGINSYRNWHKLVGAKKDAKDVKALLKDSFDFDNKYSMELFDNVATKHNIDSIFRELISTIHPEDNLIVYFAGHGTLDNIINEGYWIPVEARNNEPNDYISNSTIKKYMEALKAKHVLFIADACFSGGFFKTTRGDSYADNVEKRRSKWLLCSGREEFVADKLGDKDNSPFAYYLMDFLKKATSDGLTISKLYDEIKVAVANNAEQTPIAGPIREAGDEGGEFVFRKKQIAR